MVDTQNTLDGSNFLAKEFWDLDALAEHKKEEYAQMSPFPSIVLDNLFSSAYLEKILSEFPDLSAQKKWKHSTMKRRESCNQRRGFSSRSVYKAEWSYLNLFFYLLLQKLTESKKLCCLIHILKEEAYTRSKRRNACDTFWLTSISRPIWTEEEYLISKQDWRVLWRPFGTLGHRDEGMWKKDSTCV